MYHVVVYYHFLFYFPCLEHDR